MSFSICCHIYSIDFLHSLIVRFRHAIARRQVAERDEALAHDASARARAPLLLFLLSADAAATLMP